MQINKEIFLSLDEEKQQFIEQAFMEVKDGNMTVDQFIEGCAQTLTEYEYNNLFMHAVPPVNAHLPSEEYQQSPRVPQEISRTPPVQKRRLVDSPKLNEGGETPSKKAQKNNDENIDDIMQYTQVNLKEEAENIIKELCFAYNDNISALSSQIGSGSFEALFNIKLFSKYINRCCANRQVKITEDGVSVIFLCIYRKVMNLLDKMDDASKIRTENELNEYNFDVKNEHNKQMWYLNELEKMKFDKLNMQTDKEKKKKNVQEREDLLIKKRQSNSVAMAAMGVKQKSWMGTPEKIDETAKFDSIYTPLDEKLFGGKGRVINKKDFLYVIERDKRYNKSLFLIMQYYNQ